MRKVFLDDLPRWGKGGKAKEGTINWNESIGRKVKFIYNSIEGEVEIVGYKSEGQSLTIKYLNKEHKMKTSGFLNCKIGKIIGERTGEFKAEMGQIFKDNNRDLVILDREHRSRVASVNKKGKVYFKNEKWYKYRCEKCSYEGWIEENCLITRRQSCSCCSGRTAVLGINTIWDLNRDWVEKFGISEEDAKKYTRGSRELIKVKCPDCGKEKTIEIADIFRQKSIECVCGDGFSEGHKYMHELLNQLNINFIDNYKPKWCNYYNEYKKKNSYGEYDFIIEDMKLIIEVDGGFHRKDNEMNGQTKEESEYIDNMKDELAKENGYKVIRIPYGDGDFKGNILNSELSYIFDLSNIDWLKCEEFSLSSLIKKVCDYWNNKDEQETTVDVSKIFRLNRTTVRSYLKRGIKLGLCEYDLNKEYNKRLSKVRRANKLRCSKKVEIFNLNVRNSPIF